MSFEDRRRWQAKYAKSDRESPGTPADWLVESLPGLPRGGRGLDLAAGDGRNSLLLASRGWQMTAVDLSEAGLALGRRVAGPLPIEWVVADLDEYEPPEAAFDLVLCFHYLDRDRLPHLVDRALKPAGLFLAETFNHREAARPDARVRNPAYLLAEDEWLSLFPTYAVLAHDQNGAESRFFARKQ